METENKGEFSERPEVTPAEPVVLPGQKQSKVATILCVILAIAVIGLGVFILCDKVINKNEKKPAETANNIDAEKVALYDRDQKIKDLAYEIKDVMRAYFGDDGDVGEIRYEYVEASGRVEEGKNTTTPIPKSYSVVIPYEGENKVYDSIMNSSDFTLDDKIAELLKKQGFKKIVELTENRMWGTQHYETEDGIVCEFSDTATMPYYVSCGDSANITEETKTLVKSLAKAYKDGTGEDLSFLAANKDMIEDGAKGYQRIFAGGEDAAVIFYRKSADSEWVFFKFTQASGECSEYNTDDLKNAFAGETCWDEKTNSQSTVKSAE